VSDREGVEDRALAIPDDLAKIRSKVDGLYNLFHSRTQAMPKDRKNRDLVKQAYSQLCKIAAEGMPGYAFRNVQIDKYKPAANQPTLGEMQMRPDYQYWKGVVEQAQAENRVYTEKRNADAADLPPITSSTQPSKRTKPSPASKPGTRRRLR